MSFEDPHGYDATRPPSRGGYDDYDDYDDYDYSEPPPPQVAPPRGRGKAASRSAGEYTPQRARSAAVAGRARASSSPTRPALTRVAAAQAWRLTRTWSRRAGPSRALSCAPGRGSSTPASVPRPRCTARIEENQTLRAFRRFGCLGAINLFCGWSIQPAHCTHAKTRTETRNRPFSVLSFWDK